jgi:type IX secretion system PorP/SprF family membrane protein
MKQGQNKRCYFQAGQEENYEEMYKKENIDVIYAKKSYNRRLTLTLLLVVLIRVILPAQDIDFAQYYNNPTYYNPAAVGLTLGLKTRLNYRKQWTGLSGDYHTYSFSADIADRSLPGAGGIGMIATQSLAGKGLLKTNTVGFMPSVRIPISGSTIFQLGALAQVVTQEMNWDNLVFGDQLDPRLGNIRPSDFSGAGRDKVTFPDFAFGGIFQFKSYNVEGSIGGAVHHLTTPNQSFFDVNAKLPMKYLMHIDLVIKVNENQGYYSKRQGFKLNPGVMVEDQAGMLLYRLGMNIYMSRIYLGIWYKNETLEYDEYSNFATMLGINVPFGDKVRMKLNYTYEMNVNAQHNFTGPSHELSLIFEFDDISLINKRQGTTTIPTQRHNYSPIECSPF